MLQQHTDISSNELNMNNNRSLQETNVCLQRTHQLYQVYFLNLLSTISEE